MVDLDAMQADIVAWAEGRFSPTIEQHWCLMGLVGEVGELAQEMLKQEEGVKSVNEQAIRNEIGDIAIFLLHLCTRRGCQLSEILRQRWEEVKCR